MCDILRNENLKKDISFLGNATMGRGTGWGWGEGVREQGDGINLH